MDVLSERLSTAPSDEASSLLLNIISALTTFTNKYIMGVVMILGIFGNILSIVIFGRCKRRDLVTVTYLTPLAYADLITLIYGAFSWISTGIYEKPVAYFYVEAQPSFAPMLLCKFIRYIYRTFSSISSYILVLFSCERCIGILLPLNVRFLISTRRRLAAIALTCILLVVLNCPVIIYNTLYYVGDTSNIICYFSLPNLSNVEMFFFIQSMDSLLPHALPCCLILLFSIIIILGLRRADRETAAVTGGRTKRDNSNLVSLLLVCLLYIVSTAPYVFAWGYFDYYDVYLRDFTGHTKQEVTAVYKLGMFSTSISMMNYSFNFLIYSFTLKIYKEELQKMADVCLGRRQVSSGTSRKTKCVEEKSENTNR
ncbi:P2Y purinoceptor 2-like [Lineus longissimus]|uniref:P2Y purinoceptor 2-like n=1 Tax=Lineus longissimus TaxID=88925 RepID=UPI00315D0CDA